ncbi:MAG: flippase-like domain-containing protein [Chloroflexi bacterium]|nr:flippase-like domain-containing protein [Chloroflexota bacterium]
MDDERQQSLPFHNRRSKQWQFGLGLLISFVFLWLALRNLHLGEVVANLRGANYIWLLPTVLAYFVTIGLRAWRWQVVIAPVKQIAWRRLSGVVVLGYLGNNIYPFRIGELLRVLALNRWEGVPVSGGLATLLVERVFDGLAVLALVFVALPLLDLPGIQVQALVVSASVLFFGLLALFVGLALQPDRAQRVVVWGVNRFVPGRWREGVLGMSGRFLQGLAALRSGRGVTAVLLLSVLIWLVETAKYWFVMLAFPFQVSFVALMLTNGIVNLATILPSTPGFVGTFDLPIIATLTFMGVDGALAAAYTVVVHTTFWLSSTVLGAVYMVLAGLRWSDLGQRDWDAAGRG